MALFRSQPRVSAPRSPAAPLTAHRHRPPPPAADGRTDGTVPPDALPGRARDPPPPPRGTVTPHGRDAAARPRLPAACWCRGLGGGGIVLSLPAPNRSPSRNAPPSPPRSCPGGDLRSHRAAARPRAPQQPRLLFLGEPDYGKK